MKKLLVVAAFLGLVGSLAGCRNSCNPCAEPPPVPCQGGCAAMAKPCTCAPSWGAPNNVNSLAGVIVSEAQWHFDHCPPDLKAGWDQLRVRALWAQTHNPCNQYTCEQWRQVVQGCKDAVWAVHDQAQAPAPACTELNHPN